MALRAVKTVVTLEPGEVMRLQEVLMDEDREGALVYLREVIEQKIACAQDDTHRPEFEGGIQPSPAHHRSPAEHGSEAGESG